MPTFMRDPVVEGEGYMKYPEILGESAEEAAAFRSNSSFAAAGGDDFTTGETDPQAGLLLPAVQMARETARRKQSDDEADDSFVFKTASTDSYFDGQLLTSDDLTRETDQQTGGEFGFTDGGADPVAIGLLLPAVQKVREAAEPAARSDGAPITDDVIIDGNIITAENYDFF